MRASYARTEKDTTVPHDPDQSHPHLGGPTRLVRLLLRLLALAFAAVLLVLLGGYLDSASASSDQQAMADQAGGTMQSASVGQAKATNPGLAKLAASAEKAAGQLSMNAWQLPVTAGTYTLTAGFGQCSTLWAHCHTGLDFAAPTGTPIHVVANGVVNETGWAGAYGNRTVVTLDDGTQTWYCHQSAILVRPGQKVTGGQVIGRIGATGNTTGPHLHLEVRPGGGDPVDPRAALIAHGLNP